MAVCCKRRQLSLSTIQVSTVTVNFADFVRAHQTFDRSWPAFSSSYREAAIGILVEKARLWKTLQKNPQADASPVSEVGAIPHLSASGLEEFNFLIVADGFAGNCVLDASPNIHIRPPFRQCVYNPWHFQSSSRPQAQ